MNHVIDPTFFYDAIAEFAFDYTIYIVDSNNVDDYGNTKLTYLKQIINGSLQTSGKNVHQSKSGNTQTIEYDFYCKSLYRIDIGDIIEHNGQYLRCNSIHPYDEWGVRQAHLIMIQLSAYRDFADYLKYLRGAKII